MHLLRTQKKLHYSLTFWTDDIHLLSCFKFCSLNFNDHMGVDISHLPLLLRLLFLITRCFTHQSNKYMSCLEFLSSLVAPIGMTHSKMSSQIL